MGRAKGWSRLGLMSLGDVAALESRTPEGAKFGTLFSSSPKSRGDFGKSVVCTLHLSARVVASIHDILYAAKFHDCQTFVTCVQIFSPLQQVGFCVAISREIISFGFLGLLMGDVSEMSLMKVIVMNMYSFTNQAGKGWYRLL